MRIQNGFRKQQSEMATKRNMMTERWGQDASQPLVDLKLSINQLLLNDDLAQDCGSTTAFKEAFIIHGHACTLISFFVSSSPSSPIMTLSTDIGAERSAGLSAA
jgi:hypothetical protein